MSARKNGNTKLAIEHMQKYKSLQSLLLGTDSRQESSPTASSPRSPSSETDRRELALRIETAKKAAISAKKNGNVTEALAHMKDYKSLLAEEKTLAEPTKRRSPLPA